MSRNATVFKRDDQLDTLRPEAKLMLACCAPSADTVREDLPIADSFDWQWFTRHAIWHGVMPCVASRLFAAAADSLPESTAREIRLYAEANALRSRYLTSKLLRVLELLNTNNVEVVALKGPVFAERAYGDATLRSYCDLDILVRLEQLARANEILSSAGHRSPTYDRSAIDSGFFADHEGQFQTGNDENPIDLHWQLAPRYFPFAPEPSRVWSRSREVAFHRRTVSTLSAADELLFLCFHGAKHGWVGLSNVCDLAMCLNVDGPLIDWKWLLTEVSRLNARSVLLIGLSLARQLFGSLVPHEVADLLDTSVKIKSMRDSLVRRMFDGNSGHERAFVKWRGAIGSIDSLGGQLRYLSGIIFAPKLSDHSLMPLPRALYPLYYVARPILVAIKHPTRLVHALTGSDHCHD